MEEIDKRLKESSENCLKFYEIWHKDKKNAEAKESLQEAIHELRKASSRMEIELAITERNEITQKPLPIPPHRSKRRHDASEEGGNGESEHNPGNDSGNNGNGGPSGGKPKQGLRRGPRKSED